MSGGTSTELSVPTDLTVTSEENSEIRGVLLASNNNKKLSQQIQHLAIEKNELKRTVEKLKLELSSKEAHLVASRAEYESHLSKTHNERDKILAAKQVMITKLQMELSQKTDELKALNEKSHKDVAQLAQKCLQFQQNQQRLEVKQEEIKSSLASMKLTEEEYIKLTHTPLSHLNLREFTINDYTLNKIQGFPMKI